MKRVLLIAILCVAAVAAVPVASASATEPGTCIFKGTAEFSGPSTEITTTPQIGLKYSFKASGPGGITTAGGTCVSVSGGAFEEAEANGEGVLSCPVGLAGFEAITGPEGEGFLKVGGTKHEFKIKLAAALGIVAFTLLPKGAAGVTGAGATTFLTDTTSILSCDLAGHAAVLKFQGDATGVF